MASIEERLTALAETVQILAGMQVKTEESLQRLEATVDRLTQTVDRAFNQIANILSSHEERLDDLEGNRQ